MTIAADASNMVRPMSPCVDKAGGRGNRPLHFGSRAWALSLLFLAACSFEAPAFTGDLPPQNPDASREADALVADARDSDASGPDDAALDAGVAEDSGADDASIPEDAALDAGLEDAAPQDADAPDAPAPDALIPDTGPPDAGFADAGFPDAGFPDAAPIDAGFPDAGCAPWPLQANPRSVGTVSLPWDPDLPPLVADLDGDGEDEVALASSASREIMVLDWAGCSATPQTASIANIPVGEAGLVAVSTTGGVRILAGAGNEIWLGQYQQLPTPSLTQTLRSPFGLTIESIAADPAGSYLFLRGTSGGDPAYVATSLSGGTIGPQTLASDVTGEAAYLFTPANAPARFAVSDEESVRIAQPGAADAPLADGGNVAPTSPPASLRPGIFGGPSDVIIAYGADDNGTFEIGVWRTNTINVASSGRRNATARAQIISGPIAYTYDAGGGNLEGGFVFGTSDGYLAGCSVTNTLTSWTCTASSFSPLNAGSNTVVSNITPLTSYIGGDHIPDVVFATATGRVLFRDQGLTVEAAPPVNLAARVLATPGISPSFFDRYGGSGSLMVVPISGSRVELLIWSRPATAGPDTNLWSQHRGNAQRSGQL